MKVAILTLRPNGDEGLERNCIGMTPQTRIISWLCIENQKRKMALDCGMIARADAEIGKDGKS
jgi:hypothetical protein